MRRDLAFGGAVDSLRLEEKHRIRITNRREQQALGIGGRGRTHDLEASDVNELRLGRLRVIVPASDAATNGRSNHHLGGILTAGAVAILCQLAHDLIVSGEDEVAELDLRHDGRSDDATFTERRVDHAVIAKLFVKALGDAENSTDFTNVFAQAEHARVTAHLEAERVVDGLNHVHLRHVVRFL